MHNLRVLCMLSPFEKDPIPSCPLSVEAMVPCQKTVDCTLQLGAELLPYAGI